MKIEDMITFKILNCFDFWRFKIHYSKRYVEISWVSKDKRSYKPFFKKGK